MTEKVETIRYKNYKHLCSQLEDFLISKTVYGNFSVGTQEFFAFLAPIPVISYKLNTFPTPVFFGVSSQKFLISEIEENLDYLRQIERDIRKHIKSKVFKARSGNTIFSIPAPDENYKVRKLSENLVGLFIGRISLSNKGVLDISKRLITEEEIKNCFKENFKAHRLNYLIDL